ncbi:MAG: Ca-activated chloride channel family protein [Myxococcota bacterium]|jgi:Ca-activated chloride channel family protein
MFRWFASLVLVCVAVPAFAGDLVVRVESMSMPLPAEVVVEGPEAREGTADSAGLLRFEGLVAGRYTVHATLGPYAPRSALVDVPVEGEVEVHLALEPVFQTVVIEAKRASPATSRGEALTKEFLARVPKGHSYQAAVSMAQGGITPGQAPNMGGGSYNPNPAIGETWVDPGRNPTEHTADDALSTFSIDVDTASWTRSRRSLNDGFLPPAAMVRTEEFVNFFPYDYAPPRTRPLAVHLDGAASPWTEGEHLLRVGLQGRKVSVFDRKTAHLTFLVDVSCSMSTADKLPMVRDSLTLLVDQLEPDDTVALVTYAGGSAVLLEPTPAAERDRIVAAIDGLRNSGGTAMADGIFTAYALAERMAVPGHINRVLVASDGDANIGPSHHAQITPTIRRYAKDGITLTTLGFGTGNYRDHTMEQLANDGDGNYTYVDDMREARRVLVDGLTGTLEVIARDVKVQVAFDPDVVESYRLLGYENRELEDADFDDDAVDAGEVGSGHQVTALYAVRLAKRNQPLGEVWLRFKPPGPDAPSEVLSVPIRAGVTDGALEKGSAPLRLAVAAAGFAELLRGQDSPYLTLAGVRDLAAGAASPEYDQHAELVWAIDRAMAIQTGATASR